MAGTHTSGYEGDIQWQQQSAPTRTTSVAMPAGVTQSPTSAAGPEQLAGPSPHASAARGPQYASEAPQATRTTDKTPLKRPKGMCNLQSQLIDVDRRSLTVSSQRRVSVVRPRRWEKVAEMGTKRLANRNPNEPRWPCLARNVSVERSNATGKKLSFLI